jgi:catechol 2,3-dioxygenase-like lactoylglutathione lyase family enzyme
MYDRAFHTAPELPQISEFEEIEQALAKGMKITDGYRHTAKPPATYDVQGILLPRPFKIVRMSPVRLFATDLDASVDFYIRQLGFTPTEEVTYKGHRCVFLRCATEHTAVALYPLALRAELGLSDHTNCMAIGMQVANYQQLRDARAFLAGQGVTIKELPPELSPGIDYSFLAIDPDGHAVQFYYYMEQIGWEAKPRPPEARRKVTPGVWPEALEPLPDSLMGEPFLGPWG